MESQSSKVAEEQHKQDEIRKKIAALQAQLKDSSNVPPYAPPSPKRKRSEAGQLVPPTPSPKKRKLQRNTDTKPNIRPLELHHASKARATTSHMHRASLPATPSFTKPAPSTVLSKLESVSKLHSFDSQSEPLARSAAFSDVPAPKPSIITDGRRDENLALIEDLESGPIDHIPPLDDPHFEKLEPNSGIRLSSRILPHEDLQEYLRGRFYLSPSRLYSSIRLLPNKQGYDVPVSGDFITIAVVAERGPIKYTKAPAPVDLDGSGARSKGKKPEPSKPSGKKFINFKLVDFGTREKSSGTGGKSVIRGDALLTLLLFEADGFEKVVNENGRDEKIYKGGSRGAFESLSKIKEGDVIALLNPKILKPFQSSNDKPHPITNILAVTPESPASITVIGKSQDLGRCSVTKKDGKRCEAWCDKRVSGDVCEWHVQNAVERRRAGRAEFSVGTSGMSRTSKSDKKPEYDKSRQFGLKPDVDGPIGSTYVVSGHIISSGQHKSSIFASENMGREGQAKAARKAVDKDKELVESLSKRDKQGMRSVILAREVGKDSNKPEDGGGDQAKPGSGRGYSSSVIKHLGFDPASRQHGTNDNADLKRKIEDLASVFSSRKIKLGPRAGPKIRSGVVAPMEDKTKESGMVDLDLDD